MIKKNHLNSKDIDWDSIFKFIDKKGNFLETCEQQRIRKDLEFKEKYPLTSKLMEEKRKKEYGMPLFEWLDKNPCTILPNALTNPEPLKDPKNRNKLKNKLW